VSGLAPVWAPRRVPAALNTNAIATATSNARVRRFEWDDAAGGEAWVTGGLTTNVDEPKVSTGRTLEDERRHGNKPCSSTILLAGACGKPLNTSQVSSCTDLHGERPVIGRRRRVHGPRELSQACRIWRRLRCVNAEIATPEQEYDAGPSSMARCHRRRTYARALQQSASSESLSVAGATRVPGLGQVTDGIDSVDLPPRLMQE
jgi:hypothetical protein